MVTLTYHTQDRHFETCQVAMSSQPKGMDILLYRYLTWKFVHRISLEFLTIMNNSQSPNAAGIDVIATAIHCGGRPHRRHPVICPLLQGALSLLALQAKVSILKLQI